MLIFRSFCVTLLLAASCFAAPIPSGTSVAATPTSAAAPVTEPTDALKRALRNVTGLARDDRGWRTSLEKTYSLRAWQPLWTSIAGPTHSAQAIISVLSRAADFGLTVRDYDVAAIAARAQTLVSESARSASERAQFDALLSLATARFISDVHAGRVNPRSLGHDLDVPHAALDVGTAVAAVASSGDVAAVVADFEPSFHHYDLLKTALARYRLLASDPTLTILPMLPTRSIKLGDTYSGAAALRHLLHVLGDLPAPPRPASANAPANANAAATAEANAADSNTLFDESLAAGLRSFQERHGLAADGTLGAGTYAALTTPLSTRVRQIEMSLERSRWLPPQLSSPPILVNIPQFRLFAFYTTADREDLLLQMNVIVGKTFTRNNTPVFAADMRYVVVRPYWDVPASIVRNEVLGKMRADPAWLARNHFEIVSGDGDDGRILTANAANIDALAAGQLRLRQQPGAGNSLGVAKLMFPNSHNVYLHGTPAQQLFAQTRRAFSHGCIRVEDPLGLVAFVLRDQPQWTRARLEELAKLDHPTRISLTQPLRVFIMYATAIATESGRVLFFEDIYGLDRKLAAQLGR